MLLSDYSEIGKEICFPNSKLFYMKDSIYKHERQTYTIIRISRVTYV